MTPVVRRQGAREFRTRADGELAVHAPEVQFDRLRAEEQTGGDLPIGGAGTRKERDLELARREAVDERWAARARCLSAGAQLLPRSVRPAGRAEPLEAEEGGSQVIAGGAAVTGAAEPLSPCQLDACALEWRHAICVAEPLRLGESRIDVAIGRQQGAAAGHRGG